MASSRLGAVLSAKADNPESKPGQCCHPPEMHQTAACIYCGLTKKLTRDHIPPKLLLSKPYPAHLPTVPACRDCNQSFQANDEYTKPTANSSGGFDSPPLFMQAQCGKYLECFWDQSTERKRTAGLVTL